MNPHGFATPTPAASEVAKSDSSRAANCSASLRSVGEYGHWGHSRLALPSVAFFAPSAAQLRVPSRASQILAAEGAAIADDVTVGTSADFAAGVVVPARPPTPTMVAKESSVDATALSGNAMEDLWDKSRGRPLRLGTWRPAGKFGRLFQGPGTSDHCWNGGSVALEMALAASKEEETPEAIGA